MAARTALLVCVLLALAASAAAGSAQPCGEQAPRIPEVRTREARPGLLRRAAIPPDSAARIACRGMTAPVLLAARIQETDRRLTYVFTVRSADRAIHEVIVDAKTGLRRIDPADRWPPRSPARRSP